MRLLVLSDLHIEYAPFAAPLERDAFDVVVLAGDIGQASLAVRWAREVFPDHRIVQIAGNHEYFNTVREPALQAMRDTARALQVDLIESDSIIIGDVEFIGCTTWTDYRLYERAGRPRHMHAHEVMAATEPVMLDYRRIWVEDASSQQGMRPFRASDSVALHQHTRNWLTRTLARPCPVARRVVVTHHLPSWHSVSPTYADSFTNPAFASDLDELFDGVDLWIHGHTHSSHDYYCAGCRVVCNPRGYPMRAGGFENPRFDPMRVIDI